MIKLFIYLFFFLLLLPAQTPTFYIASPPLSSTLASCHRASLLVSPYLPCSGIWIRGEEKASKQKGCDGVERSHFYHRRTGHPPLLPGIGSEESTRAGVGSASPNHGAGAGTGARLRGPGGAPGRGRAVPHLPELPAEDERDRDLPEAGQQDQGGHHHLRPQGLGVRGAQEVHLLQPHERPAQDAAPVPRLPRVLLAGAVQEPQRAQPGEHLRGGALHAQPHRRHGHHLRQVHVVQAHHLQQRLRHGPRRGLLHQQGAPADADLHQGPAARAGARAGVRGVGSGAQPRRQSGGRERQGGLHERRLRHRCRCCELLAGGRWVDDAPVVREKKMERGDLAICTRLKFDFELVDGVRFFWTYCSRR